VKQNNIIQEKSFKFALRIIKLTNFLREKKNEFVLSKQLFRCGTSIGANVEEAIGAFSTPDFISKMTIAYKEARETNYWIRLLKESGLLTEKQADSLLADCEEILKIIGSIQKTVKGKLNS